MGEQTKGRPPPRRGATDARSAGQRLVDGLGAGIARSERNLGGRYHSPQSALTNRRKYNGAGVV